MDGGSRRSCPERRDWEADQIKVFEEREVLASSFISGWKCKVSFCICCVLCQHGPEMDERAGSHRIWTGPLPPANLSYKAQFYIKLCYVVSCASMAENG